MLLYEVDTSEEKFLDSLPYSGNRAVEQCGELHYSTITRLSTFIAIYMIANRDGSKRFIETNSFEAFVRALDIVDRMSEAEYRETFN